MITSDTTLVTEIYRRVSALHEADEEDVQLIEAETHNIIYLFSYSFLVSDTTGIDLFKGLSTHVQGTSDDSSELLKSILDSTTATVDAMISLKSLDPLRLIYELTSFVEYVDFPDLEEIFNPELLDESLTSLHGEENLKLVVDVGQKVFTNSVVQKYGDKVVKAVKYVGSGVATHVVTNTGKIYNDYSDMNQGLKKLSETNAYIKKTAAHNNTLKKVNKHIQKAVQNNPKLKQWYDNRHR